MWYQNSVLKLFLALSVLLCCSYSAYSQDVDEPLTAAELQGLSTAQLIEIILIYDQALTDLGNSNQNQKIILTTREPLLNEREIFLNEESERQKERTAESNGLDEMLDQSLELQKQKEAEQLTNQILTGIVSAAAGVVAGMIIQASISN